MPGTGLNFRFTVIFALVVLAGCSTNPPAERSPVPVEDEPTYAPVTPPATRTQTTPAPPDPNTSSAYAGLVDKADQASGRGDYEQALALLERAQRIDPDSGEIYLNLAKTYRAKGDETLAAATAERGLLYCQNRSQCDALRSYLP
jgi:tetratricopeptide (TPR) repeat protein